MSSKKLYTDIDLNGNKIVNLKADTVASLPDAILNSERIVYYDGDYYYSDGTGWTLMANVVPTGGTAGQVLSKIDGTNYNTQWITPTSGGSTDQLIFQAKYNQVGGLLKGQAVYVSGANGTNILVSKADYSLEATSSKTLGLAIEDGANNHMGAVISDGLLSGLNTSAAGAAGDPVWLGDDGNLIYGLANKPYAPNHLVFIGIVTRKHSNNGEIFVKVQNGFELQEIHDVDLISTVPVNGDVLGYNGTLWVNKSIALWLGFTPENVANKSTNISLGTSNTLYPTQNAVKSYVDTGLSNYVPYTGANANVNLGANSITANAVSVSTFGDLSTAGTDLILQAAANKNLVINTPNITSGATTKIQFGGVDVLELKGPSSTTTITNFRYTNPDNTGQSGPVSSMIIDPGSREWGFNLAPDQPNDIQKEIEILAPTYTVDALIQTPWTGTAITLYVNDPNTGTSGGGVGIGLKGSFLMDMYDGDLVPDPVTGVPAAIPTNMIIGKGSGTIIGSDQAKLSFFGKFPAVAKPSAVTTVQGLANALSSLGLLETSTIAAWTVLSAASNVNPAVDGAYYIINTATAITITLPSPTSGRRIGVKAGSAPTTFFTINTVSGTIDGAASVTLNNQYDAYVFIANGSNWFIES